MNEQRGPWGNPGSVGQQVQQNQQIQQAQQSAWSNQRPVGQSGGIMNNQHQQVQMRQQNMNAGQRIQQNQQVQQNQQTSQGIKSIGFRGIPIKSGATGRVYEEVMNKRVLMAGALTEESFLRVTKHYDVASAIVISHDRYAEYGIQNGGLDVRLEMITGETFMVSRKFLVENFRIPGKRSAVGKRIHLLFVKNNTPFLVIRNSNELMRAIFIPDKYSIDTGGRLVNGGHYLVCKDINGVANKNNLCLVDRATFRCVFSIPMQEGVKQSRGLNRQNIQFNRQAVTPVKNMQQNQQVQRQQVQQRPVQNRTVKQPQVTQTQSKYKYTVVNKIMSFTGVCVGYTVREISNGRTLRVTEQQLKAACYKKLVDNVVLVNQQNGKSFLRGNGIDMSKLPKVMQME